MTASYIAHHLAHVSRSDTLFSDDAAALIQQSSLGLPRLINNRAVQSLVANFAASKAIVDESAAPPRSPSNPHAGRPARGRVSQPADARGACRLASTARSGCL